MREKNKELTTEIGIRIQKLRKLKKMSQQYLATEMGVSFQQIQKYEKGINELSASRLKMLGRLFNVPISYFLSDKNDNTKESWLFRLKENSVDILCEIERLDATTLNLLLEFLKSLREQKQT